ncbi:sensor histidine kinase [Myceligenerans cantabricum]
MTETAAGGIASVESTGASAARTPAGPVGGALDDMTRSTPAPRGEARAERRSLYERVTGWFDRHRFGTDATLAACAAFFTISGGAASSAMVPYGQQGLPAWFLAAWAGLMTVPFVWLRTRPVASAGALFVLTLVHVAIGHPLVLPIDLLLPCSLYALTAYGPRWAPGAGIAAAAAGCTAFYAGMHRIYPDDPYGSAVAAAVAAFLIFVSGWALGLFRRSRRAMLDALRDRADRLQLERDQQAEIAAGAERARIAREMHDVVAHSLSIVIAQADGGRYAARSDPRAAERSLSTIAETGRAALADMRTILGVLRTSPAPGAPGAGTGRHRPGEPAAGAPPAGRRQIPGSSVPGPDAAAPPLLAPQPDVAQIEALAEQCRAEGMHVSYARVGEERRLPSGLGLNVFRVAQEALTNVRKHGGPDAHVAVQVRWGGREVELTVSDDGRGLAGESAPSAPGSGYGLVGMRERAELFGGELTAGARPGGGFRVRLVVPIPLTDAVGHSWLAPGDVPAHAPAGTPAGTPNDEDP